MKVRLILILIFFKWFIGYSQKANNSIISKNSVQIDFATLLALGKYDFAYERFIFKIDDYRINTKLSYGEWYYSDLVHSSTAGKSFSLGICGFSNIGNHHLELGFGGKYLIVNNDRKLNGISQTFLDKPLRPNFVIGYRYQQLGNGLIFRSFLCDNGLGIGLGYGF